MDADEYVEFNWVLLVLLLVVVLVSIFFLFYFNRAFGRLFTYLLRLYIRFAKLDVYIDIQSVQVSLLAGRIFFGKVTYHGTNQSIIVLNGHITWRYWFRHVRKSLQSEEVGGQLPCRIRVHIQGLEWFIYNRSPAYDNIINEMTGNKDGNGDVNVNYSSGGGQEDGEDLEAVRSKDMGSTVQGTIVSKTKSEKHDDDKGKLTTGDKIYLEALPIEFKCDKGAIVMGNANTPSVMVAQFQRGFGTYSASMPRSSADKYKTELNAKVRSLIIDFRDNEEYVEGQHDMGKKVYEAVKPDHPRSAGGMWDFLTDFAPPLADLFQPYETPIRQPSTSIDGERWMGLQRYIDDRGDPNSDYEPAEYAKIPRVLEAPEAEMSYFWDVVGPVGENDPIYDPQSAENVNGSLPPEFGLDLSISDAKIHYGPWADRQRFQLQSIFFPRVFKDNKPKEKLKVGEERVYTTFKVFIELQGETVVQVPTKEPSKDWKIRKTTDREARPPGWLGIRIAHNSTISYSMGMVPLEDKWENTLHVELNKPEVRSSVNHGLLYRATSQTIVADMSSPLQWKSLNRWKFKIDNQGIKLFVLREHVILFTDLIGDWGAGPAPEFATFTPYIYEIDLNLRNFLLYINVNDGNIINDPSDLEENTYLLGKGALLTASVTIPLDRYIPAYNEIPFNLVLPKATLELQAPPWNTQASFLDSKLLAKVSKVGLSGSYHYASSTGPTLVDTLSINLPCGELAVRVEGSFVRYLLNFQKNYFGESIHFKTLDEHNEEVATAKRNAENPNYIPQITHEQGPPKSNDIDVIVQADVRDITLILPANLYSDKSNVTAQFSSLAVDMRFTNYYMDLQVNMSPISASLGRHVPGQVFGSQPSAPQAFIDGLSIFGHRLFGLPPTEPTYVCCWDIALGSVTGECSTDFTRALISAMKALDFGIDDFENALPLAPTTTIHDATFLRVKLAALRLWLHVEQAVFLAEAGQLDLSLNDLADLVFSERISIKLPGLRLACFDEESVQLARFRDAKDKTPMPTHAVISTDLDISVFNSVKGLKERRRLQQKHIREHDQPTNRAIFMLQGAGTRESSLYDGIADLQPSLPLPSLPTPVTRGTVGYLDLGESISEVSSQRTRSSREKGGAASSFRSSNYQRRRNALKSESEPSFHSALQSQTLEVPVTPHRSKSATNMAFITPPQIPATRQNVNRPVDLRRYSSAGVMFASSYIKPKFPLDGVEPCEADMPKPLNAPSQPSVPEDMAFGSVNDEHGADEDNQTTLVLEASNGVKAFLDPFMILAAGKLLHSLQAQTVEDLLDELQISVLTRIAKLVKKKKSKTEQKTINLCVKIPFVALRLINRPSPSITGDGQKTFLDFSVGDIDVAFQSRGHRPADLPDKEKTLISLHAHLSQIGLQIQSSHSTSPAASITLTDILAWTSTHQAATSSLSIANLAAYVESGDILHFINLAETLVPVVEEIAETFASVSKSETARLRRLIYTLAVSSEEMNLSHDPSALTKPSIILRSTPDHVRVNDSWKMLGRIRHIYRSMVPAKQRQIDAVLQDAASVIPSDAKRAVIRAFESWRSWEMSQVGESRFVKSVFGKEKKLKEEQPGAEMEVMFSLGSAVVRLDPGPRQQEFVVIGVAISATIAGGKVGSVTPVAPQPDVLVQVYCQTAGASLSWEVLDLVQDLARYFNTKPKAPKEKVEAPPPMTAIQVPKQQLWQVVLTADNCSLRVSTVNLKLVGLVTDPRMSLLVANVSPNMAAANLGNVLWEATSGSLELVHANKLLATFRMRESSIFANAEVQTLPDAVKTHVKAVVGCQELSLDIREQVLGLMEALDLFVCDELAQVRGLIQTFTPTPEETAKKSKAERRKKKKDQLFVNAALSLENFSFCAALLPSLAYIVRGGGIRLSTRQRSPDEIMVDFDLLHHEHEVRTAEGGSTRSISLLQMPEINARVRHHDGRYERLVEAFVSVETIELEVSAMQSLLNALNKPEVGTVLEDVKGEWTRTKAHLDALSGPARPTKVVDKKEKAGKVLVYRAHVGVAGLHIQTKAPNARLDIRLGSIQGKATNKPNSSSTVVDLPEVGVDIQRITVELTRRGLRLDDDQCGYIEFQASLRASSKIIEDGRTVRVFSIKSRGVKIDLYAATASTIVDVAGHLQDKLRDLDLSKEVKHLRKLRRSKSSFIAPNHRLESGSDDGLDLFQSIYVVEIQAVQLSWIVGNAVPSPVHGVRQNLVLSIKRIGLETDIRNQNEARLGIEEFVLQMVDENSKIRGRTENSALLPNVNFAVLYGVTETERTLKFDARGESVDLRLTSSCAIGMSHLQTSIAKASDQFRKASENWKSTPTESGEERKNLFGRKRFASILVDADFAGAIVRIQGSQESSVLSHGIKMPQASRYGQFASGESSNCTVLRTPGLAFKVEYSDPGTEDPSLNGEVKISASTNALYPSIVPLILEMSENVKNVVKDDVDALPTAVRDDQSVRSFLEEHEVTKDSATAILGRCRLNLGLRICQQQFSLSCQPIARVEATARYEDIYITVNTCEDPETGRFYALSGTGRGLECSLRHVYSREETAQIKVDQIDVSLMNSKYLSGASGLSVITKLSPISATLNVKQIQDFLLFREIWLPEELRTTPPTPAATSSPNMDVPTQLVKRYHKVAAAEAFPWNTTVSVESISLKIEFGPSLGTTTLSLLSFWLSSRKTSDWEQTMYLGFDKISVVSDGRLSGHIELTDLHARTSIRWHSAEEVAQTPLVEAALGFGGFKSKVAFEYQPFLVADVANFEFLMYNLRQGTTLSSDQLVGILDGEKVNIFATALSASQGLALWQAIQKLSDDKRASFETALREVEKYLLRAQRSQSTTPLPTGPEDGEITFPLSKLPNEEPDSLSLRINVVVNLKEVNLGAFPNTFQDSQIFKLEAADMGARFAVEMEDNKLHSQLSMTLGQLRIALSSVRKVSSINSLTDISVQEVVANAIGSRGGTILKVPHVSAAMHTWHVGGSNEIDFTFKSAFEGKVDVGWNYTRIQFIRNMWTRSLKAMSERQGKPLPSTPAISINATNLGPSTPTASSFFESPTSSDPEGDSDTGNLLRIPRARRQKSFSSTKTHHSAISDAGSTTNGASDKDSKEQPKITAVVNVPQSRYTYKAVAPPIIETPQLRDMGEATPPLEWIGFNRERLPNLTHQIVIVSLLEIAREVEDAYFKILGR